ncbi:perforin-1-like [Oncorhynchus keta]|uniref:perforin-1-like n=1 Tax=Oncorhynchus keta TaxID=8018 RepID=UPI00227CF7C4|nr:perforin-1-like [Oncorhynchus keta]XP_052335351.1 perforin-1-like [Oncorhynchus keta]
MASLSLSLGLLVLCTLALVHCDLNGGPVRVYDIRASNLKRWLFIKPSPYVKVWCGSSFHGKSNTLEDQENPIWADQFNFANILPNSVLTLEVWDDVIGLDHHMGTCKITIRPGTHSEICQLKRGTVYYSYSYGYVYSY